MDTNKMKAAIKEYGFHWNAVNGCDPCSFSHSEAFCLSKAIAEATGIRQSELIEAVESYEFGLGNSMLFLDECAARMAEHIEEEYFKIDYEPCWQGVAERMYA